MFIFLLSLVPLFVPNPLIIDGELDSIWFNADIISDFTQQTSNEGETATEKTEVYVLADYESLYVAFKCYTNRRKPQVDIRIWDNCFR